MNSIKKTAVLVLAALMCLPLIVGCDTNPADTTVPGVTTGASGVTTEPIAPETTPPETAAPGEVGYVIPEESLTGMNTKENPSENDGNPQALYTELTKSSVIKQDSAQITDTVDRLSFAFDIAYLSGFLAQQASYICTNVFTDLEKNSSDMRRAEIAVNQGFMTVGSETLFAPAEPVTYGEVLRGLLYVLGYREYADAKKVAALSAEIGLSDYIDLAKKNSSTVTYGELAQVFSNALSLPLVQCVEKDGAYYTVERGENYKIETTYLKKDADEKDTLFRVANTGWNVYPGGGYRYGPSMILEDNVFHMWTASNSGVGGEVDWGKYRVSYDGGKSWTIDTGAVRPTSSAEDWNWSCDPGLIKIGEYYYAAYTTIFWHDGLDNNMFLARSKTPQGAFVEKWTGDGWGYGDPKSVVTFDGPKSKWGAGEGVMVLVDNTIYLYSSWNDNTGEYTKVYTAPADDPNWPAKLEFRGTSFKHDGSEDSCDVKYVDAYGCYIAVATASRFSENCYVHIWVSYDGIFFRHEAAIRYKTEGTNLCTHMHNMGITGDATGHIDIFNTQHYIGYAYQPAGFAWANWPTRIAPITWVGTDNYGKESTLDDNGNKDATTDKTNTPAVVQLRITDSTGGARTLNVKTKGKVMTFIAYVMKKNGSESKATAAQYAAINYYYDETKVTIDKVAHKATLLVDEVVRVYAELEGLMCEFVLVPDYLDQSAPVDFYAETNTITFYYRNEVKQPGFIAKSVTNAYLMLWGNTSSYTDSNTSDQVDAALRKWDQGVTLSGWDETIVKVNPDNGQITALAVGETTLTATYMGKTATIKIVVERLR